MEDILKQFDLSLTDAWMILVGAVLFVGLWRVLKSALFDPFIRLVEAREAATTGAADTVREIDSQTQEISSEYEASMQEARIAIQKERLTILEAGRQAAAKIQEESDSLVKTTLNDGRAGLEADFTAIRNQGLTQVDLLANLVVEKLKPSQIQ